MNAIKIIAKTYFPLILIFGFFRLLLFLFHQNEVFSDGLSTSWHVLLSFVRGINYDLMTSSYILLIPYLLLIAYDFTRKKIFEKIAFWWVFVLIGLAFMLTAANVIYYNKFYQFINLKTFEWFDDPFTVTGMIFQEPRYWWMFIVFFIVLYIFYRILKNIFWTKPLKISSLKKSVTLYILFSALMFWGVRGRIGSHPLRIEDAFTLHNNFLNELKLNPVFVLEKSYENYLKDRFHPLQLMETQKAVSLVQRYLHVKQPVTQNPVSRKIEFENPPSQKNVVLILMESMAAWKMKYFGNTEKRTPFLDSLFLQAVSFSHMYSNGIHTYAGIYGLNFGYPLIFDKHPLKGVGEDLKTYYGLPQILKKNGYQTLFFIPHNKSFDNLGAFLSKNAYDKIYFEQDYPSDSIRTIWGVDDHFLFNFALKKIDALPKNKPFLSTILTISDHGPFYVPDFIQGKTEKIRATRFADWSLHDFFTKARKKPWFNNTVFILVADHGEARQSEYPVSLSYNHIPALFYYQGVQPQIIDQMAGQIDVMPTLMHLLQTDYINQTFGQDMLAETRPYIYFNYDNKYGIVDHKFLLVMDKYKTIGLYKYAEHDLTDYKDKLPEKTRQMETYLKAHIQTAKYILDNDLQKPPEK